MVTLRTIVAGPCKLDLQNALFLGQKVRFTVQGLGTLNARITAVEQEDGSLNHWNLQGYVMHNQHQRWFSGYFRTDTRVGQMKIDREDHNCPKCGKVEEIFGRCKHCQE